MSPETKKCSLKVVHNGRTLAGGAAQLAYIKQCGGWDHFIHHITDKVARAIIREINAEARRPTLSVISGGQSS